MRSADPYAIELRNRIYHFALVAYQEKRGDVIYRIDTAGSAPLRITLRPAKCEHQQSLLAPAETNDWTSFKREFLGLTQTCRQLREEFLLLYRETIHVVVALCDVRQYVAEHVTAGIKHDCDARGNVLLNPRDARRSSVDMRGVILLASEAPGVKFDIMSDVLTGSSLKLKQHSAWHRFLSESVSQLRYAMEQDCDIGILDIDGIGIYVKPEHAEEWMTNSRYPHRNYAKYLKAFTCWAENMEIANSWLYAVFVDER